MMKALFILSLICVLGCLAGSEEDTSSSPLILTPHLEKKSPKKARELSKVTPDLGNVQSYSGYFTVLKNETCENNLFFWYFPAVKDWLNAPMIVWLQGGPGSSSMYGLFELIGPFKSLPGGLKQRETSWTNFANVLFIDSPVGAGYSFTNGDCYPNSIAEVAEGLYSALKQFYQMFDELQKNDLFLAGESFAGHYIPTLGTLIDTRNSKKKNLKMNLKGIIMGNPNINLQCHDYGSYLYQVGIADSSLRDQLYESQQKLKNNVKKKNYLAAFEDWDHIIYDLIGTKTGIDNFYSSVTEVTDPSTYITFLNTDEIKKQIHAGSQTFVDFNEVTYDHLSGTIAQPFSAEVQKLLRTKKYIVAIYSGNLDIICMYTSAVCVMSGLKWQGQQSYLKAPRSIWYLDNKVVGWFKTADNLLLEIVVKDAQHAAIYSHPEVTYQMMESIVSAKPGDNPLWALQTSASSK